MSDSIEFQSSATCYGPVSDVSEDYEEHDYLEETAEHEDNKEEEPAEHGDKGKEDESHSETGSTTTLATIEVGSEVSSESETRTESTRSDRPALRDVALGLLRERDILLNKLTYAHRTIQEKDFTIASLSSMLTVAQQHCPSQQSSTTSAVNTKQNWIHGWLVGQVGILNSAESAWAKNDESTALIKLGDLLLRKYARPDSIIEITLMRAAILRSMGSQSLHTVDEAIKMIQETGCSQLYGKACYHRGLALLHSTGKDRSAEAAWSFALALGTTPGHDKAITDWLKVANQRRFSTDKQDIQAYLPVKIGLGY